jgi:hypothetical protein
VHWRDHFHGQVLISDCVDEEEGYAFELKHEFSKVEFAGLATLATPCVHENNLIFIQLDMQKPIMPQLQQMELSALQFDQFGIIAVGQQFTWTTLLMDFRIRQVPLEQHACLILASFQQVQLSYLWDLTSMNCCFSVVGDDIPRRTVADFWENLLHDESLRSLKLSIRKSEHNRTTEVTYQHDMPLPPDAFDTVLAIAATRKIMDALAESNQIRVVLKWKSKAIWDGPLDGSLNMTSIASLLQCAMYPVLLGKCMRLIHKAKQCCDVTVQQLLDETSCPFIMIQMVPEFSGGVGSKESQKSYARNSLAASLLEQGFALEWVSKATDVLVDKIGLKHALQISQMPPGKQRTDEILKLCEKCSLSTPPQLTKAASKVAGAGANKTRKRVAVQINPADYQIESSFFIGQNDEPLPQIQQVRHKTCGVSLMTVEQALPWIQEQQLISPDELGMVVLGSHENVHTSLRHELLHVPCKDAENRPIIMKATLFQLGEKAVKTHVSQQPIINEQTCKTVAVTFWQEDWTKEDWDYIVDHPFAYARQVLAAQGLDAVFLATWGRSLRKDRQPTTAQHATSVQFHATVASDKLRQLLTLSGFNRVWITPKDNQGRLDMTWRVIWTDGSIAHLTSLASKTNECAGMVRNKKSLGLRYAKEDFELAWAVIYPDKEVPKTHDVQHLFQVQSLPYGCSAEMLEQWSQHIQWGFKAIKALGPNAWLIGSSTMPPEGLHLFNNKPVLLKYLPPRDTAISNPIIAGPRPRRQDKHNKSEASDATGPNFDPWASYTGPKAMPSQPKDVPGPSEARFQEHSAKLQDHTDKLSKLETALAKLQTDTQHEFQLVSKREQQNQMQMQAAIASVKTELETSFQHAINNQSLQLNNTLGELRQLLQAKPKRSRPDDQDDDDGMEG